MIAVLDSNAKAIELKIFRFRVNVKAEFISEKSLKVEVVIAFKIMDLNTKRVKTLELLNDFRKFIHKVKMIGDPKIENIAQQKQMGNVLDAPKGPKKIQEPLRIRLLYRGEMNIG